MKTILSVKFFSVIFFSCLIAFCSLANASVSFFAWKKTASGTHCYQFMDDVADLHNEEVKVLNNGKPVDDTICKSSPITTIFQLVTEPGGFTHCYQYSYDGRVLNSGRPLIYSICEDNSTSIKVNNSGRNLPKEKEDNNSFGDSKPNISKAVSK